MSHPQDPWPTYLEAARRKIEIASFHAERLGEVHTPPEGAYETAPAIPIQAYFEGVVLCVIAAVDQVAQAINAALELSLAPGDLVGGAFPRLSERLPELEAWFADPRGRDLRRLRVRMVHYAYRKSPNGGEWVVEEATSEYGGSRELLAYAQAAVEYGRELVGLLPRVEELLADESPSHSEDPAQGV